MSETTNLKLKKHDNVETNTDKFDIENYLNGNFDKIDEHAGEVNTNISNINSKSTKLETELKEMQEDFYQNSIRGQASGEYIHVEDSSNCRAKIGISGNSEQETRSGKNMLELMEGTYSNNGITAVVKDGIITLNGTATAISFVGINLLKSIELTNDKAYHLSAFNEKTVGDGTNYCSLRLNQDNIQVLFNTANVNGSITTNLKISYITIRTAQGITYNNFVVKPQLELGAGTNEWEQGGVSPSPDYLSEIKAVGDNVNLANLGEKAQYTSSGFTVSWEDSVFKMSGTASTNLTIPANVRGVTNAINLGNFKAGTYTVSKKILNGNVINAKGSGIYLRSSNGMIASIYIASIKDRASFTLTEDTNIYIYVFIDSETQYSDLEIGIKIAEGTEVGEYSKFGQGCVKITKYNKNLINKNLLTNYQILEDTGKLLSNNTRLITPFIYLKKGTYSLSCNLSRFAYAIYNLDKSFNSFVTWKAFPNQIVLNSDCYIKIEFIINPTGSEQVSIKDITYLQLEKGTTTSYEEHQEQTYIMPTQQPMRSISDIRDTFVKKDDKWYERHYVERLIFDGTEGWNYDKNNNRFYFAKAGNKGSGYIMSSHYKKGDTTKQNYTCEIWTSAILFRDERFTEREDFINMIKAKYDAGTPIYTDIVLQEPQDIECTEEQSNILDELSNARTYKNVTNITTDSKAILSLDYAKDLETLLNNTQALAVSNASEGV